MKTKHLTGFAMVVAFGFVAAPTASASYMEKCNALIAKWDACKESSVSCDAEQKAIEEQCKCHKQKGDDWKLVMAAVGKDGVCAPEWPEDIPPDPSPPPRDAPKKDDPHTPERRG